MNIGKCIQKNRLNIIVKPNSSSNEIVEYNKEKNALVVRINAAPEKGEANKEVVKFFRKLLKKDVRIKSGFTSKEKVLEIE